MRLTNHLPHLAVLLAATLLVGGCSSGRIKEVGSGQVGTGEIDAAMRSTEEPEAHAWMHPDVPAAWDQGFRGDSATLTVLDDFTSGSLSSGDLGTGERSLHHGEWVQQIAHMVAPEARTRAQDFEDRLRSVQLAPGLNVINASFAWQSKPNRNPDAVIRSHSDVASMVDHAREGRAVVVKAAGNSGVAVGRTHQGNHDYLNEALIGQTGAIFVGALERNGTTSRPARLASYSNVAGDNPTVQNQFLVVGVEGHRTNLYGTSYAAPVVSGYAAILGSKFRSASAPQIANQLLSTARTDTVRSYSSTIHGRGEASLSRALAPDRIR
jgi:hypothetical protein